MNVSFDITIYELLFVLFTIIGGLFVLWQWRQNYKLKRAEFLKEALLKIREDKEFASTLYIIDYGEDWYTGGFSNDHIEEQKFDLVFSYFDYLCYLKNKHILGKSEFRIFEYKIRRMTYNKSFLTYMFNLYHFSNKNGVDISFYHLLMYLKNNKLLPNDFWNKKCSKYSISLNIK